MPRSILEILAGARESGGAVVGINTAVDRGGVHCIRYSH